MSTPDHAHTDQSVGGSRWAEAIGRGHSAAPRAVLGASAALDRLTHHARVTVITGESYRQRHRRKEVKPTTKPPQKQ